MAEFPALVGLLMHPAHGAILYDTGYSEHFLRATDRIPERLYRWVTPHSLALHEALPEQLKAFAINPEDVRLILISHFHADHIAGLKDFPNARFVAMQQDWSAVSGMGRVAGLIKAYLPALLPDDFSSRITFAESCCAVALPSYMRPFTTGFDLFGDGSIIGVPLRGHSRCQMGIVFRDESSRPFFLVADSCWSLSTCLANQPPSRLASLIESDHGHYLSTFQQVRALASREPDVAVIPSHCAQSWRTYGHAAF